VSFKDKMMGFVVASVCLLALTVSALAEKVDLMCPSWENHSAYFFTIDPDAMTVKDMDGTHTAEMTDDHVIWYDAHNFGRYFNLQSAALIVVDYPTRLQFRWNGCVRATKGPD